MSQYIVTAETLAYFQGQTLTIYLRDSTFQTDVAFAFEQINPCKFTENLSFIGKPLFVTHTSSDKFNIMTSDVNNLGPHSFTVNSELVCNNGTTLYNSFEVSLQVEEACDSTTLIDSLSVSDMEVFVKEPA